MTRQLVRSLSTQIRILFQVVDKISEKINKMRGKELCPQLNELIQGLSKMWKSMLGCHRNQCQAYWRSRDAIASHKRFSDAQLEATLQLELGFGILLLGECTEGLCESTKHLAHEMSSVCT